MTGLDKIINRIKLDADNTCAGIKSKADAECTRILSEAQASVDAVLKDAEEKAEVRFNDILTRAQSTAELESRRILLCARQEVITSMISSAKASLKALPDDEYFELIYKMVAKYSDEAQGVIAFSKADLDRLPSDFESKVNSVSKGTLTVSAEPSAIDSGFVLIYGGVEVNCSFDALFSDNNEKLSDAVSELLFS